MTLGPREAVASEGQVSESKLPLGSEALYHDLSQELLNHTAPGPAIQPARLGPAHAAILALCENAADNLSENELLAMAFLLLVGGH